MTHPVTRLIGSIPSWVSALLATVRANDSGAVGDGVVLIPESAIQGVARQLLDIDDLRLSFGDRSLQLSGTFPRAGVPFTASLTFSDQTYIAAKPLGSLVLKLESSEVGVDGGLLKRVVACLVLAVLRGIYGDGVVLRPLTDVDGVTVEGDLIACELSQIDRISTVLEYEVYGFRVADLFSIADIAFESGQVRVQMVGSAKARRLSGLFGIAETGSAEKGEESDGADRHAKWLLGKASDLLEQLSGNEDRNKD